MKFTQETICQCGEVYCVEAYGDAPWKSAACPKCHLVMHAIEPLSVSTTAERLLFRSKAELESGDYTLAIVIGAIAVETFLTRMFLKQKGMENYALTFTWPNTQQEKAWELEYPHSGGFAANRKSHLGPADFIADKFAGMTFNDFVEWNSSAKKIAETLPKTAKSSVKQYFQKELFNRRNRIVHWGYVNSTQSEGQTCHDLSVALVSILRAMDNAKYGNL